MGTAGGWSLPSLLRAEESAGKKKNPKSVIMIYLVGGPPHQEHVCLKPVSPQRVRRSVETDRNQCPRDGDLRSLSQAGDNGDKLTIITIAVR